jgi:hypothetical protein
VVVTVDGPQRGVSSERFAVPEAGAADQGVVLQAVRDDIRQTLRAGWIDPAVEAAAASPVFFTAAWSAIRPNVGKSFLTLARNVRTSAVGSICASIGVPDLRGQLEGLLGEEELHRVEDATRASHQVAAKFQVVVHALLRAIRRERVPGTGREEPPVRRGVPDWQSWISIQAAPEEAWPILESIEEALAGSGAGTGMPVTLRLLARWPAALSAVWAELDPFVRSEAWIGATMRARRLVLAGITSLPHPIELQWTAIRERGFGEVDRLRLLDVLAGHDAAMAHQTVVAAFAWLALGSPEIGADG